MTGLYQDLPLELFGGGGLPKLLELELYRSGSDIPLTLVPLADETAPLLWQGSHPLWMDGVSGERCERPEGGMPLEALARRIRALVVGG